MVFIGKGVENERVPRGEIWGNVANKGLKPCHVLNGGRVAKGH